MQKNARRGEWIFGILSLALIGFIFARSLKPAELSSEESGVISDIVQGVFSRWFSLSEDEWVAIVRKTAHFCEFAALGFCVKGFTASLGDLRGENYRSLPLLFCLLIAMSDEMLQMLMPGRSCEVKDALLDFAGAIAGTLVLLLCRKRFLKK